MATSSSEEPAKRAFVSRGGALALGFFGIGALLAVVVGMLLGWPGTTVGRFARGWPWIGCAAFAGGLTARSLGRWSARGMLLGGEGTTRGVVTGWVSLVAAALAGLSVSLLMDGRLMSVYLHQWLGLLWYVLAVGSVPASFLGWLYGRILGRRLAAMLG